jgi:hypothetical protein
MEKYEQETCGSSEENQIHVLLMQLPIPLKICRMAITQKDAKAKAVCASGDEESDEMNSSGA